MKKCFESGTNDSINRTQLGTFGNNPSMMKLFELIRSSYQIQTSLLNSSEIDRFRQLFSTTLLSTKSGLRLISTQEFLLNLHKLVIVSSSSAETKTSNISSQISLNNSLAYIHTITSEHEPEAHALAILEPIVYDFFLVRVNTDSTELEA
ncbi:unnamed protein product [Rotaria sp. Silwood1]|nr:unnamed protein product [Rotaria sp. Silwood1]CAF1688344.1 unnamed protein product [Rotaria sp. Silwood1]